MSLPHLLMGLLYRKPDSGYDLNKRFERTVAHFWSTDQSQIYRTLYKLRDNGWVKVETVVQDDNPNKKVYSLTDAGHQALVEWLSKPIDEELVIRDAETGQVFFGEAIGSDRIIELQHHYIEKLKEKVAVYRTIEEQIYGEVDFNAYPLGMMLSHVTLQYGIRVLSVEIKWREDLIERIKDYQQHQDKRENNT